MCTKRVTVISVDPWADRLHGASILNLMNDLSYLGYNVELAVASVRSQTKKAHKLTITTFKFNEQIPILPYFSFLLRVTKHLLVSKPDVVLFDFPSLPCFMCVKLLTASKGILLIFSRPLKEHGIRGLLRLLHFKVSLSLGRLVVDQFTAISPFEAASFSSMSKISPKQISVIPSPLGKPFSKQQQNNTAKLRSLFGIANLVGKTVFLYHGVLDERRGVLRVLELFEPLNEPEIALLVVGSGPATDAVKRFIQNAKSNIVFKDALPYSEMPNLIAACDVGLVLLPDTEDWRYQTPTKLVEFLSLGKSVLASDLPGIHWVVEDSSKVTYLKQFETIAASDFTLVIQKMLATLKSSDTQKSDFAVAKKFSSVSIARALSNIIEA
jgi:glycosyltransferase involved in cell wall biosynthesis